MFREGFNIVYFWYLGLRHLIQQFETFTVLWFENQASETTFYDPLDGPLRASEEKHVEVNGPHANQPVLWEYLH